MAVRVDTLIESADRILRRQQREAVREISAHLSESARRINQELGPAYRAALAEIPEDASRAFREARARVVADQLQVSLQALDLSESEVTEQLRRQLAQQFEEGSRSAQQMLARYRGQPLPFVGANVNLEAIELMVANSRERLFRYAEEAQRRIRQEVIEGLARGRGNQVVARQIREQIGVVQSRAETIARTELASAMIEAQIAEFEREQVPLVQWVATEDERTCEYCGARHGNVYERDAVTMPAHPNCRCAAAPMRREWIEEGLADREWWQESQREVDAIMQQEGIKPNYQATPFERAAGRRAARAVWTPRSGWRR